MAPPLDDEHARVGVGVDDLGVELVQPCGQLGALRVLHFEHDTGQRKAKLGMAKLFDVSLKRGHAVEGESVLDDAKPAPKTAADLL